MLNQDKPVILAGLDSATSGEISSKHKNCNFRSFPREETSKKHQLQVTAGSIKEHIPCGV